MRMIGTISSAVGFIFLGIWMIIRGSNEQLADAMFKWWPIIIIILGIEVIASLSKERFDEPKPRFNGLVIFVIIVFLFVNGFKGVFDFNFPSSSSSGFKFSFGKLIANGINIDDRNYKKINTEITLDAPTKRFSFDSDSAVINLYKSNNDKIRIDGSVYVDKNSGIDSYKIKPEKDANGYAVNINEDYVKKVSVDVYVPEGCFVKLRTDSSSIKGRDKFTDTSYEIDSDSSNVELEGGSKLSMRIDSGLMKIKDVKDVNIDSDSGTINLSGDVQYVTSRISSGMFNLDNDITKKIDLEMSSGIININTNEKNIDVDATLDNGICTVNGEKRINSGIKRTYGNGDNKIKVRLDSGTLKISSRE